MKEIFIIAPHFPPSALPPSQRVRLMVKHFNKFGFYPVVFTVDHYYREEIADPWMTELAGNDFDLITIKCLDQRKTRRFGIGDLGLRMLPNLYARLLNEAKKRKPAFILYPVPPWYIMVIAPFIKRVSGVKFGIDFIDPWVHNERMPGFKAKASQWIARNFEGFVLRRSDLIVAVSQEILNDIKKRHAEVSNIEMVALPYGVEVNDYASVAINPEPTERNPTIRYIGAISNAMIPVVGVVIKALTNLRAIKETKVEFIGTSYAGLGAAKPKLEAFIKSNFAEHFIIERPDRVSYKEAVHLKMQSDVLLLIGDTTHYYAASKLMGLIASGKPFVAFVHEKSFPAIFLLERQYKYILTYSDDEKGIQDQQSKLTELLYQALVNYQNFGQLDASAPSFEEHTAYGMTKKLTNSIKKVIDANKSLRKN